uniref:Amine oxidase domain-containing protein n=1 Tax=Solanum lycopersicum TaxID=4081 RepID=A0A3Q7IFG4_SOLLC
MPYRSKPFYLVFLASPNIYRSSVTRNCIYERKGISVPDPIQSICLKWRSDPFSSRSYSLVCVQSSENEYDILIENLGVRLFFVEEATIRQHPATWSLYKCVA